MPEFQSAQQVIDDLLYAERLIRNAKTKIAEMAETIDRLRRGTSDAELPEANRASQESGS